MNNKQIYPSISQVVLYIGWCYQKSFFWHFQITKEEFLMKLSTFPPKYLKIIIDWNFVKYYHATFPFSRNFLLKFAFCIVWRCCKFVVKSAWPLTSLSRYTLAKIFQQDMWKIYLQIFEIHFQHFCVHQKHPHLASREQKRRFVGFVFFSSSKPLIIVMETFITLWSCF